MKDRIAQIIMGFVQEDKVIEYAEKTDDPVAIQRAIDILEKPENRQYMGEAILALKIKLQKCQQK